MKTSDYVERCGNCHAYMIKSDLFCRYCGTKRGDGAFEPFDELEFVQYAYGRQSKQDSNVMPVDTTGKQLYLAAITPGFVRIAEKMPYRKLKEQY